MDYSQYFNTKETSQSKQIPGSNQIENSAGGFVWAVDDWKRLDRFLILGTEGGSYYASEKALTIESADVVLRCLKADGLRTVARIVKISVAGRAPKNDQALFALALATSFGNLETRQAAFAAVNDVARMGTYFFTFLKNAGANRGWGRAMKRAGASWYTSKTAENLAYQILKYRQRDGWSHRDVLRLAHPVAPTPEHEALFRWTVENTAMGERDVARQEKKNGPRITKHYPAVDETLLPKIVTDFERLQKAENAAAVAGILGQNKDLTWEMVPKEFTGDVKVWEPLLPNMKPTALIRNLARLTANGLLGPMNNATRLAVDKITDAEGLKKERVHPIAILGALATYRLGRGVKGNLVWNPVSKIIDALDEAFYLSFENVVPSGKRTLLCLDISGSMETGQIAGMPGLTPRVASAAMALVSAKVEKHFAIVGFTAASCHPRCAGGRWCYGYSCGGRGHRCEPSITQLNISPRQRMDDVIEKMKQLPMGGTDCSLPMRWALANNVEADAFVVYTDNETWHGDIHPLQALQEYRRKTGIPAKLVVVGMVANEFSIADSNDAGMMDVVGFDTAAPNLISDFIS